jgi:hypothetical protein
MEVVVADLFRASELPGSPITSTAASASETRFVFRDVE